MGAAYQVRDGLNGRLIDPGPSDQAEIEWGPLAALEILGDPTLRARLGAAGAATAAERAELSTVMERLEQLMETALQHCRDTVLTPLSTLSQAQQERSLRSSLRSWSFWNALFLGVSYSANPGRLPHRLALAMARANGGPRPHH